MKLASRSWSVGKFQATLTIVLPIFVDRPHHAEVTWEPTPEGPMTDSDQAQFDSGLSRAIREITAEPGAMERSRSDAPR